MTHHAATIAHTMPLAPRLPDTKTDFMTWLEREDMEERAPVAKQVARKGPRPMSSCTAKPGSDHLRCAGNMADTYSEFQISTTQSCSQ